MNWGHKITLVFGGFVCFIGFLAYQSFQQRIDLVSEDYYLQEIKYQQQIDKIRNTKNAHQQLAFSQQGDQLIIGFPEQTAQAAHGNIHLFRPSDARFDQEIAIAPDVNGQQAISTAQLAKGYYKIKVDWQSGTQAYFTEESIFIH